jgi:hypothetical protein
MAATGATGEEAAETGPATTGAAVLGPLRPRPGALRVADAGVRLLVAEDEGAAGGVSQWATSKLHPHLAYRLTVDASGRASCACPTFRELGRCVHSLVANGEA